MLRVLKLAAACCLFTIGSAYAACTGTVTFGEGAALVTTPVPNKEFNGRCFNQLIVDTVAEGSTWDSEAAFVLDVAARALQWADRRLISFNQVGDLLRGAVKSEVGRTITVRVIGFNDFHGNLQSPGTFGVNTVGAAGRAGRRWAAPSTSPRTWRKLKGQNPLNVVVGAGDFIGASPLISALFFDEPAVEALNRIGLEFNAVGNHEFDKGSAELLRLQNGGCKMPTAARSEQLQGRAVGTPVPLRGREVQVALGQRGRHRHRPAAAAGLRHQEIRRRRGGLHRHDAARPRRSIVTPSGVAGLRVPRRGRHRQRAGAEAARAKASRRSSCWCTRAASRAPALVATSTAATATSPARRSPRS